MDDENVRPEEAEIWLKEHGFHGGPTVSDAPPKFRHFTWLDSTQRAVQCHQFHAGAEFIYRATKPTGWTSPTFSTPWAAVAYADLCGWGHGEPAAQGELELLVDRTWQKMGVNVRMYPGEPIDLQFAQGAIVGNVTAARAGGVTFYLPAPKTLDAFTEFRLTLTCGYN